MPHLVLEYSANIRERIEFLALFKECHELLAGRLPTSLKNCKSRVYVCENYYVGDGNTDNAFAHLAIKIMPGRSKEILNHTGEALLELLKKYFSEPMRKLNLELSLEIIELHGPYFKS